MDLEEMLKQKLVKIDNDQQSSEAKIYQLKRQIEHEEKCVDGYKAESDILNELLCKYHIQEWESNE